MKIVPDAPGAFLKRSFSRFARALHTGQYTFSVSNIAAPFCMWIVAWMGFEPVMLSFSQTLKIAQMLIIA
jgi:hypothetical protein